MLEETLVEIECHICGKLVAIAGFSGDQRRNKTLSYLCSWCDYHDDMTRFVRPEGDFLINASIHVREGTATKNEFEAVDKWGLVDEAGKQYRLLRGLNEAKKKMEAGDYKGYTEELLSIVKTLVKG
jgi:hypothetical protein